MNNDFIIPGDIGIDAYRSREMVYLALQLARAFLFISFLVDCSALSSYRSRYSWLTFTRSKLSGCLLGNTYLDYAHVLNQTTNCFRLTWYNCLYVKTLTHSTLYTHSLCNRLLIRSSVMTNGTKITIRVPPNYTINATLTQFSMDKTPFGCKRNRMQIFDGSDVTTYCGVRDQWSIYTKSNILIIRFVVFKVDSRFQVELFSTILDMSGSESYTMYPSKEINIYRGHPKTENFTLDNLLISRDPIQVYLEYYIFHSETLPDLKHRISFYFISYICKMH